MASCGEYLVRLLEQYRIDTVFGIPGNHTVQLYRGLADTNIRHISPRHEQGAAFMADGYARATGNPAACFLISGPGLGNAITPLMQALADSVPMLVITAVAAREQLGMGEGRLHEVPDQRLLASQCTRFSHTLMRPDELPKVLARAYAVFESARPGPVHIEIPLDVITAKADHLPIEIWPRIPAPGPDPLAISLLAEKLLGSSKPIILAGGGAASAARELRDLVEHLMAPLVLTVNGKGILPPEHPLLVGGGPSLGCVREALAEADCVLAIGTEFGETDYDMLFLGPLPTLQWLARVDIDAQQLSRNQRADLPICGASAVAIKMLKDALSVSDSRKEFAASAPTQMRAAKVSEVAASAETAALRCARINQAIEAEEHFHPQMHELFEVIRQSLPDVCLVGDSTLPTYYAVWQYRSVAPRRYFHSASGAGTLGYAIPAAIGASRALRSEVPVVALIGDGAAQFTITELAAAVQESLPIIVLLWNNHGYREIRAGMVASEVAPVGVDVDAPDFIKLAQSLGCQAARIGELGELGVALTDAWQTAKEAKVPVLLELSESDFVTEPAGNWYR
ncbi:MAG: 5-guanidino-2-oxopentanoate decarboxylase [Pseudomonadota bacterium]